MPDDRARLEGPTPHVASPNHTPEYNSSEVKRLKGVISRAAIALKDADLLMMVVDAHSLGKRDLDSFETAIEQIRLAWQILVER